MVASRILITLVAMLILLMTLAREIDRKSHGNPQKAGQSVGMAATR